MQGIKTARSEGLVGCKRCGSVFAMDTKTCEQCGARLISRNHQGLTLVWLWWGLGVLAYIPANIWPMLETRMLLDRSQDTILEGTIKLASHGSYGVALVIFLASVAIPIAKFMAIAFLALSVGRPGGVSSKWRHRLYEFIEFIGRWSMVDVFVVAILSSLVQFSFVATVKPGAAALAFALSVIFTMLSAHSFDARLIWDLDEEKVPNAP